jgi:hypothetical protein
LLCWHVIKFKNYYINLSVIPFHMFC